VLDSVANLISDWLDRLRSLPRLLFRSIVGGIHAPQETVDNAVQFLLSSVGTLEAFRPGLDLSRHRNKISSLMENPKLLDPIAVLSAGALLAHAIDESVYTEFQRLMTELTPGDAHSLWCIKAAVVLSSQGGGYDMVIQFIEKLPGLCAGDVMAQRLALAFTALAGLIHTCPSGSSLVSLLVWAGILSASHSSQVLRQAGLLLLLRSIPQTSDNAVIAVKASVPSLAEFEGDLGIDFTANFAYAFAISLTRSLEETQTRKMAVEVLKAAMGRSQPSAVVFYLLPFIAFADEDPQNVIPSNQTLSEVLFSGFSYRGLQDLENILGYLSQMFGDTYCAHRMELIADCLIFGGGEYPDLFGSVKTQMMTKCWKMLEGERNSAKIDKIATVAASFYILPSAGKVAPKTVRSRMGDAKLGGYMEGAVRGLAAMTKSHR
jgi:hypothetical protein